MKITIKFTVKRHRSPILRTKAVRPRKGKGSYSRKGKHNG